MRPLLEHHAVNYLDISQLHKTIFAYLDGQLKLISTKALSNVLESQEPQNETSPPLISHSFNIPGEVSQIKLNADQSTLYIISTRDGQTSVSSIDVMILLRGNYNEITVATFPSSDKLQRFYPSPVDPNLAVLLLDSGILHLIDSSKNSAKQILSSVSAVNWFGDLIMYSSNEDTRVTFFKTLIGCKANSFHVEKSNDEDRIRHLQQLDETTVLSVLGGPIDSEEEEEYTSIIITLTTQGLSPTKFESTSSLYSPFGVIPRIASFYTLILKNWSVEYPEIFVSIGSKSTDVDFFFKDKTVELLNDSDRATMPMDDDSGDDDTPLGVVLDLTSSINVMEPCKGVDVSDPLPRLAILTNRGQLLCWNIWTKNDILNKKVDLSKATTKPSVSSSNTIKSTPQNSIQSATKPALAFGSTTTSFGNSAGLSNPFGSTPSSIFGSIPPSKPLQSKAESSSIFGGSSTAKISNPFGQSSFSGQSPFGGQSPFSTTTATATNSNTQQNTASGRTKAAGSFGFSGFASALPTANATSNTPAKPVASASTSSTPFGTSASFGSSFGKSTFGVNNFKMGAESSTSSVGASASKTNNTVTTKPFTSTSGGFAMFSSTNTTSNTSASPFGQFSKNTSGTGSLFGSLGKDSSLNSNSSPFSAITSNKIGELSGVSAESTAKPSGLFGAKIGSSQKTPFSNLTPAIPQTSNSSLNTSFGSKPANLFGAAAAKVVEAEKKENPPSFGQFGKSFNNILNSSSQSSLFQNNTKSALSPETKQKIEELESDYEEEEIEEESRKESEEESEESDAVSESGEDDESFVDLGERATAMNKPILVPKSSVSGKVEERVAQSKQKEAALSLDEQISQFEFDFELNSNVTAEKAVRNLLARSKINFEGAGESYRDFIISRAKFYDETLEDIDQMVSEWEKKRVIDKKAEQEKVEESKQQEHNKKLDLLFRKREQRDLALKEVKTGLDNMSDLLSKEAERRRNELEKLSEERAIESEIDAKIKEEEESFAVALKLITDQMKEVSELAEKQEKVIAEEAREEQERLKALKEKVEMAHSVKEVDEQEDEIPVKKNDFFVNIAGSGTEANEDDVTNDEKQLGEDTFIESESSVDESLGEHTESIGAADTKDTEKKGMLEEEFENENENNDAEADENSEASKSKKSAFGSLVESNKEIFLSQKSSPSEATLELCSSAEETASKSSTEIPQSEKEIHASSEEDNGKTEETYSHTGAYVDDSLNESSKEASEVSIEEPAEKSNIKSIKELAKEQAFVRLGEVVEDSDTAQAQAEEKAAETGDVEKVTETAQNIDLNEVQPTPSVEKKKEISGEAIRSFSPEETKIDDGSDSKHLINGDLKQSTIEKSQSGDVDSEEQFEIVDKNESLSFPESSHNISDAGSKITAAAESVTGKKKIPKLSSIYDSAGEEEEEEEEDYDDNDEDEEQEEEKTSVAAEEKSESAISSVSTKNLNIDKSVHTESVSSNVSTLPDMQDAYTYTDYVYIESSVNALPDTASKTVIFNSTRVPESVLVSPEYSVVSTDVEKMVIGKVSNFEEDEVYFSKHYIPMNLPLLHARGEVTYPEEFEQLPPLGKEMKKLIYDVFIDFSVLHKNIVSMNEYISDQSNESLIFHTLESSSGFSNFWRFFEVGTLLQGAEKQAKIFSDLSKHYGLLEEDSVTMRKGLFADFRKLSEYKHSLDKLTKKDLEFKRSYVNSNRPLSFENVKTRRNLRERVKTVQEVDRTVQSELLILKSQVYPEQVVKDDRSIKSVVSSLQNNLYGHADTISSLSDEIKELKQADDRPKKITFEEGEVKDLTILSSITKEPTTRISGMLTRICAQDSLAEILKNKANNNRYVSL